MGQDKLNKLITKLTEAVGKDVILQDDTITETDIENALSQANLPAQIITKVFKYPAHFSEGYYYGIQLYTSEKTINNVQGQYPDMVSLSLKMPDMRLQPQGFAGNGGRWVYRKIDKAIERERYLALGKEKVPFRTPQPNKKAVLTAITKFAVNYLQVLKNIHQRNLEDATDLVDYSFLD